MAKSKRGRGNKNDAPKPKNAAKEARRLKKENPELYAANEAKRVAEEAEQAAFALANQANVDAANVLKGGLVKKSKFKPVPEDYPNIVATFGTNEKNVHATGRTITVDALNVAYHGRDFIQDASLNLAPGQRYGLVGANGSGKTTLLRAIASRMIPFPKNIDCYLVDRAIDPSDSTALESVLEVNEEKDALDNEATVLGDLMGEDGLSDERQNEIAARLNDIYIRLDELDADTAESRAGNILQGLGFTKEMQRKKTSDFSGGWRMRISLARALFLNPEFLILDEPTAHLDMEAVVWVEEYLKTFTKILLLVSHSQVGSFMCFEGGC